MVGYEEKALCRKVADMFEIAGNKGYDVSEFTENWLYSSTARRIYDRDFNEIAQSPLYVLNSLLLEQRMDPDNTQVQYSDLLYWLGYMITYMEFSLEKYPFQIWEDYDVLGFAESYDVLHTLSCKSALENIEEDYKR